MTTCPTTSGPYRCEKDAGHGGPCECEAAPYRARKTSECAGPLTGKPALSTPGGGSEEPGTIAALAKRVRVLEEQVASLQMAAPRGIPR